MSICVCGVVMCLQEHNLTDEVWCVWEEGCGVVVVSVCLTTPSTLDLLCALSWSVPASHLTSQFSVFSAELSGAVWVADTLQLFSSISDIMVIV